MAARADEVAGDDCLAMAGTEGVRRPPEKRDHEQRSTNPSPSSRSATRLAKPPSARRTDGDALRERAPRGKARRRTCARSRLETRGRRRYVRGAPEQILGVGKQLTADALLRHRRGEDGRASGGRQPPPPSNRSGRGRVASRYESERGASTRAIGSVPQDELQAERLQPAYTGRQRNHLRDRVSGSRSPSTTAPWAILHAVAAAYRRSKRTVSRRSRKVGIPPYRGRRERRSGSPDGWTRLYWLIVKFPRGCAHAVPEDTRAASAAKAAAMRSFTPVVRRSAMNGS